MKFEHLSWIPILIPFIIGCVQFKNLDRGMRFLFYFVCYGLFNELASRILDYSLGAKNTMPLTNAYLLFSFLFLGLFYFFVLNRFVSRKILLIVIFGFELLCVLNIVFIQSIYEYPVITYPLGNLLLVAFSIIYFYKIMIEAKIDNLWREPLVWINAGILIYFSGNLFYNVLFNLILEYSREFLKLTLFYFSVLNALFYILFSVGFYLTKNQVKKRTRRIKKRWMSASLEMKNLNSVCP
jgi:hypothetical protein